MFDIIKCFEIVYNWNWNSIIKIQFIYTQLSPDAYHLRRSHVHIRISGFLLFTPIQSNGQKELHCNFAVLIALIWNNLWIFWEFWKKKGNLTCLRTNEDLKLWMHRDLFFLSPGMLKVLFWRNFGCFFPPRGSCS